MQKTKDVGGVYEPRHLFCLRMVWSVVGCMILALGQPCRLSWLCPLSATIGFALFYGALPAFWSLRTRFLYASTLFAFVQGVQLSWMTSIEFHGYYILFVYALLCIGVGLQFGAFSVLVSITRLRLLKAALLAAVWTIFEWTRLFVFCGFSWNPIGLAETSHVIPLQCAAVFGILGLSFWVMFTNLLVLNMWYGYCNDKLCRWKTFFHVRVKDVVMCGAAISAPYVCGGLYFCVQKHFQHHPQVMRSVLVQTNLLPSEKMPWLHRETSFITPIKQWDSILDALEGKVALDLIVLPEAVVPWRADATQYPFEMASALFFKRWGVHAEQYFPPRCFPYADIKMLQGINTLCVSNLFFAQAISNFYQAELVVGLDYYDQDAKLNYNSVFLLAPGNRPRPVRYDKRVLLPLAECLPWNGLRSIADVYGIHDFFTEGKTMGCLGFKHPLGVTICYEDTFAELARESVNLGSEVLINVTNDNYFPDSSLSEQHLYHARVRTVESGRPLLRACNKGVTAVIDSLGHIVARLEDRDIPYGKRAQALECAIAMDTHQTLFSFWGESGLISLCLGGVCCWLRLPNFGK